MSLKREKSKNFLLAFFLLITLILFTIENSNGSLAINVFKAERGVNMKVSSNENALIGIKHEDSYTINKGEQVNFVIQNNLPYASDYKVSLQGEPILSFSPINFNLESTGNNQEIIINTKANIEPGIYTIKGTISALSSKGQINVDINFKVKVK